MLSKLTKYEFKACMRTCTPVYLAVILAAILVRVFLVLPTDAALIEITRGLTMMLYGVLICAILLMTFIIQLQRFNKNLLGDEGYLMLTLPVTNGQHIISKSIVALILDFFAAVIIAISIIILVGDSETFRAIGQFLQALFQVDYVLIYALEVILLIIMASLSTTFYCYMSIAIGHTAKRHRTGMAIVAYFGIQFALQFVFSMLGNLFKALGLYNWLDGLSEYLQIHIVLLGISAWCLIFAAICFFITRYILNNKLNLE